MTSVICGALQQLLWTDFGDAAGITVAVSLIILLSTRELLMAAGGKARRLGVMLLLVIAPLLLVFIAMMWSRLRMLV